MYEEYKSFENVLIEEDDDKNIINGLTEIFNDLGKAGFVYMKPYVNFNVEKTQIVPLD